MNKTELVTMRTANTKVFANEDHSITHSIYLEPIHYQEEDGSFQEMDDTLTEEISDEEENTGMNQRALENLEEPTEDETGSAESETSGEIAKIEKTVKSEQKETATKKNVENGAKKKISNGDFINRKGTYRVRFKNQTSEKQTVSMTKDGYRLEWGIIGSRKVKGQKTNASALTYPNVLKDTDLSYRISGEQIKENLILKSSHAPAEFTYRFRMKGLIPCQENHRIHFCDEKENPVFILTAPYMRDAGGKVCEKISMTLTEGKNKECLVTLVPDEEWLTDPERTYPVVLDPVTTTSTAADDIYDAHVDSENEGDNYHYGILLKTRGGDTIQRSFLKFPLPEIAAGDMVVNARLVMVSLVEDQKERSIAVHRVLQDWSSATLTWRNAPIYEEIVQDIHTFKGDKQKYVSLDITRLVKDWYENGGNFGVMVKELLELDRYTEYLASDCHDDYAGMRPRIDISYVNYSGLEDYWSYHSQSVGRAGTVHVNDYNGNLILENPLGTLGGSRMPVSLAMIYNTNDRAKNLGYGLGWRLSLHETIEKVKIGETDYYKHVEGDGTVHYFYYDTEKKKWLDESNQELELTVDTGAASGEAYVLKDKKNNRSVFNKSGYLWKLKDQNGNTAVITYAEKRIVKVTDSTGKRSFTINYKTNSEGKRTNIREVIFPKAEGEAEEKKTFVYSGDTIVKVLEPDGSTVLYAYDDKHRLTKAQNIDGYHVVYEYNSTGAGRVKKITEYGGDIEGNSLSLTYGYNSTIFTDHKGRKEIYRFNNAGNLIHIHDGFGHALSGKFNKDGNHVNRLENETKLQDNIVQLLRDPIIQEPASSSPWISSTSDSSVTAGRNTVAEHCKTGTQSLKLASTTNAGYGYWRQDVKVKKGSTYTFSMYVKAQITSLEEIGRCYLRARYTDKNGTSVSKESEGIRRTTDGFLQLVTTFTIPADAKSDTVSLYLNLYHVKGTLYGDMAQLETGDTANRCNLIDNGSFHLGTTTGFTGNGTLEDGLVLASESTEAPAFRGILVTTGTQLRKAPNGSSESVASLVKGQHLCSTIMVTGSDGKYWYRAVTSDRIWGYVPASQAVIYVSGGAGTRNVVMAKNNGILYSSKSLTASRVQEGIPKGSRFCAIASSPDDSGKVWWSVAGTMDDVKYHGYVPEEDLLRLCRNHARGKANKQANLYAAPNTSSAVLSVSEKDSTWNLRGQVQTSAGVFYGILHGTAYGFLRAEDVTLLRAPQVDADRTLKGKGSVPELDSHVYRFLGEPTKNKKLTKTLSISGKAGDTYLVNAWGLGTALPEADYDKDRRFGVEVVFVGTDGKEDVHYTNFSPDVLDWQFLSDVYVAKKAYTSIKVSYTYCHQANAAFFDGLSLFKEEFGQTYTYDKDNNLISVIDAQKQNTKFEYNSNQDMTGITDVKGNKFTYEYDKNHNPIKGTSAQKVVRTLAYDSVGNVIKSGTQNPDNAAQGTWITRTFTNDKNHVASVTDAGGNTVRYQWDENRDLMTSVTDAKNVTTNYTYDKARHLTSVSMQVGAGESQTVENTYGYTKDRLTDIGHNGFHYGFAYDPFGNLERASVAGQELVRYERSAKNGTLLKCIYGNGDMIRYEYDAQDRVKASYYRKANTSQEKKLYSYVYNKQGELAYVTNHTVATGDTTGVNDTTETSGITYQLFHDFLGRLMRVVDLSTGHSYEYHYDANNNMTSLRQSAEAVFQTSYGYDKDNRETTVGSFGHTRTTHYDKYGRVERRVWNEGEESQHKTLYRYWDNGNNIYSLVKEIMVGGRSTFYEYDGNGNITKISEGAENATGKTSTYQYDRRNQLIRENNHTLNKTRVYSYDLGGNLTRIREYDFTTETTLPESPVKTITGTFDPVWKDKLTSWNGISMTYDAMGNMLTKGDTVYTWTQGRKLASVSGNGHQSQYFYDHTGMRVQKIVDGVTTDFRMAGELLMSQKRGNEVTYFSYDSNAQLIGMSAGSNRYFYIRNAQNDITGLIDEAGNRVVEYKYDSWGRLLSTTGSLASTIGKRNPFRYRGYYYDEETGMYYLQSRYYDPEIQRFLNADEIIVVTATMDRLDNSNLFEYCLNNPVNHLDSEGNISLPNWAKVTIGVVTTVAAVTITVATGGAALPVVAGVVSSTVFSSAIGYATGGKQGAIDGAADGFMWGGIGALAVSAVGAVKTVKEYKKTIDTYKALRIQYKGTGMEAHHIIERRLIKDSVKYNVNTMPSIELTKEAHQVYTDAWKATVPYRTYFKNTLSYRWKLYKAANHVYKNDRVLRMAARYTLMII